MLKKIVLILLSINLLVAKPLMANVPQEKEGMSFAEAAALCALGVGAVAATVMVAPIVVPAAIASAQGAAAAVATQAAATGAAITAQATAAGTVIQGAAKAAVAGTAIKGVATTVAAKAAAAAPIAMTANAVIAVGQTTTKFVYQSPEKKLKALEYQESLELAEAKVDLANCIEDHKASGDRNSFGAPAACDDLLMLVAMMSASIES